MILVTGATGMLGGHLVWQLLQENQQIIALRRNNSKTEELKSIFRFYKSDAEALYSRIIWRDADVEDLESLTIAFEGITFVYHCAAMVSLGKSSEKMLRVNVGGTHNVVEAALAASVKKICYVSSIAALPNGTETIPIDEETLHLADEKSSLYGESKRIAEKEIKKGIDKGLKAVIVNPGVIIGYSKNKTGSGELFKRVKAGLPFYTNGMTGYVAVQDVVRAMMLLMKSEISDERFVLVGENKTHKEILSNMADGYGKFRPFIGMDKSLIYASFLLEFFGKLFRFTPVIDRSSARTSVSRKSYSSEKFLSLFPVFTFTKIRNSIFEVCEFDIQKEK